MAHGLSVDIPHEFGNVLGDAQDGWNDGILTADEMSDDPEAAALLLALRQSIADQLGIPVEDVILTDITDDTGTLGRRRALGEKPRGATTAFAYCEGSRCSLSV